MNTALIITRILYVLILISILVFSFNLVGWIIRTKPYLYLWHRYKGNVDKLEEIRREQFLIKQENDIFVTNRKEKITDKLYNFIAKTSLTKKFPSLSVSDIMNFFFGIAIISFLILTVNYGFLKALLYITIAIIALYCICKNNIYKNRFDIEKQMYDFVNACASASSITPNIVDIFGNIYQQMDAPLSGLLEECYLEARQTHDDLLALRHLRNKSDSFMFQTVIDAFGTASQMNESYQSTLDFLRPIVSNNDELVNIQLAAVRNTRIELGIMFIIGIVLVIISQYLVENALQIIISTLIGQFLIAIAIIIIIIGLTMHPN